jgi:hypothetical protein
MFRKFSVRNLLSAQAKDKFSLLDLVLEFRLKRGRLLLNYRR